MGSGSLWFDGVFVFNHNSGSSVSIGCAISRRLKGVYFFVCRKARRKERECSSAHEHKLYLEEAVLERNIPETDLRQLVDLPPGLGYEEWLASHSE